MTSIQGPRVRQRFVASARYRRDDADFLEARALAIQLWNGWVRNLGFSEFSVIPNLLQRGDSWSPEEPTPSPTELALKRERMNRRHAHTRELWAGDWKLFKAFTMWEVVVHSLCMHFWPSQLFPNWTNAARSPATGFVAACLLTSPHSVDADNWIPKVGIAPRPVGFDPILDGLLHPARWYERCWRHRWQEGLRQLQEAGYPPTNEYLAAVAEWATEQAAPWYPRTGPAPGEPTALLPFHPGMSSKDYQDAGPAASRHFAQDHLNDLLHSEAHRLASEGNKVKDIAGRLGVTDRTVKRWLERTT